MALGSSGCNVNLRQLVANENETACKKGRAVACLTAGVIYYTGKGVETDYKKALHFFRRACDGRLGSACYNAATLLRKQAQGNITPAALHFLRRSCFLRDPDGCSELGIAYRRDAPRAAQLFARACRAGGLLGCHNLAELTRRGDGVRRNRVKALAMFEALCDKGLAIACVSQGMMLESRRSGLRNRPVATRLFELGCKKNLMVGCYRLGLSLRRLNPKRAFALLGRACQAKIGGACVARGEMALKGITGKPDRAAAVGHFESACQLKHGRGCYMAALTHLRKVNPTTLLKATYFLDRGCHLKHYRSCYLLGSHYHRGLGVKKDPTRALKLFRKACQGQVEDACLRLINPPL